MITPAFELTQDPDFLTIIIRVPYARASEFDVYFEGEDFKFYAKPYFLRQVVEDISFFVCRLTLPGRIVEDGREEASYNTDKGTFTIRLPKEIPGQYFEGLDMLTSLLAPKKLRSARPLVEEIAASAELSEEEEEEFDWEIEQTPYKESAENTLPLQYRYGFGNLRSGVFQRLQDELSDVIDIKDPDQTPGDERRRQRLAAEAAKFEPDHYLADFFEDEAIQHVLKYKPWWVDAHEKMIALQRESHQEHDTRTFVILLLFIVVFSEEEREQLRKFTNKSYLLDKRSRHHVYLGLIDILLAYCYEICVNEGDKNVESSWNIRKLSATLCWLESFTSIHDVLVSFGRRVLCYPLHRHFGLVTRAFNDTVMILQLGKAAVLKCLLDIHKIFMENDPAYILNDLFITDYCIWIQKTKSKKLAALSESLQKTTLAKSHIGFELEELEAAAVLVQEEERMLQAAGTVSKQQLPSSESETSDSEESSSTSSSETEGSDSDERESSTSEDEKINSLQGTLQEERTALLIDCNGLRQGANTSTLEVSDEKSKVSLQPTSVPGKLIEELEKQMHTAIRLSEQPEGLATASCILQEQEENC
ncbi:Protein SHQ1, partial [Podiceps cristatus]